MKNLLAFAGCPIVLVLLALCGSGHADHWLSLNSEDVSIGIDRDLAISVYYGTQGKASWKSSTPIVEVQTANSKEKPLRFGFGEATQRSAAEYEHGVYLGHRIQLSGFNGTDAELTCVLAIDEDGRLNVEVSQTGGDDAVREVLQMYSFSVRPEPGNYLVVPIGSGYMIRADSPVAVKKRGMVGALYSLPVFALVQGDATLYQIVQTWWDAQLRFEHEPGRQSTVALDWRASLGRLDYARQVLLIFERNMDHVDVAKAYRRHVETEKQLHTLVNRIQAAPKLETYLSAIEYRVIKWESDGHEQTLDNIRRFQEAGLPVTFFHPKWPSEGRTDNGWQEFLWDQPKVDGGWPAARKLQEDAAALGCLVKFFLMPWVYHEDAPYYDQTKLSGVNFPELSDRYAVDMLQLALDHVASNGVQIDAIYFDGHAANWAHEEHQSAEGPISRRDTYQSQLAGFGAARGRNIIPGAELARFWCMGKCDYFFFTDWASDRLREGEPIPLYQLVFDDCYVAHFSGGGYYDGGKYDWYADRHPRLYELMYGAMPSHNWLPGGEPLIEADHWGTDAMEGRLKWLRLWHAYFQATCYAQMQDHRFLNPERTVQRIEYSNGVSAEFDLSKGLFRVEGVPGIEPGWQSPPEIEPVAP